MPVCIALTPVSPLEVLDGSHKLHPATEPATEVLWLLQRDPSLLRVVGAQTPDALSKVPVTTAAPSGYCPWQFAFQRANYGTTTRAARHFRQGSLGLSFKACRFDLFERNCVRTRNAPMGRHEHTHVSRTAYTVDCGKRNVARSTMEDANLL